MACGFQENMKPQSDSPTVSKESFNMLMAVAANENFNLALVNIRAAFLQSRTLDRHIFMLPPSPRYQKTRSNMETKEATLWLR